MIDELRARSSFDRLDLYGRQGHCAGRHGRCDGKQRCKRDGKAFA
jgi:hypothetical protein